MRGTANGRGFWVQLGASNFSDFSPFPSYHGIKCDFDSHMQNHYSSFYAVPAVHKDIQTRVDKITCMVQVFSFTNHRVINFTIKARIYFPVTNSDTLTDIDCICCPQQ